MLDIPSGEWKMSFRQWLVGLFYAIAPAGTAIGISLAAGHFPTFVEYRAALATALGTGILYIIRNLPRNDTAAAIKVLQKQAAKDGKIVQLRTIEDPAVAI